MIYDTNPRRAWRQWVQASDRWEQRLKQLRQAQASLLPWQAFLHMSRRAYNLVSMAQDAAKEALLAAAPPFPEHCRGMPCGATTRKGTPCKRRDLYHSGRCWLHGGGSTGPRTPEGKYRAALNGFCPKRKRTP
jgi:hypothetical protein